MVDSLTHPVKVCLFDPSIRDNAGADSPNLGDLVIRGAIERELQQVIGPSDAMRVSTKVPLPRGFFRRFRGCDLAFYAGTNMLCSYWRRHREWKIKILDAWRLRRRVRLLGVGWWQYQDEPDRYTRMLLRCALARDGLHAARDEYTRQRLARIGFANVVNTGCPTMWPFVNFDAASVPCAKSDTLLLMLTDYSRKPDLDRPLLELAQAQYRHLVFWPQGRKDLVYFQQFNIPAQVLDYSFDALNGFLRDGPACDYVGTRLHGGVHCLLSRRRSLIIEVDNRATEIARDTGLPTTRRDDFEFIRRWMVGPTTLNIRMNAAAIDQWRGQFRARDDLLQSTALPSSPVSTQ